jgi:NAD(P)-dependent dehydrogenase (short-subunit alcohol dehydrogenase family)
MTQHSLGAVLVLGASRGLGRAIAMVLAAAAYPVGLGCRRLEDAQSVSKEIKGAGGQALPLSVDVTSWREVEAAASNLAGHFGQIAGLVNNAGVIDPIGHLIDTDPAGWGKLIEINVTGSYYGVRAILPYLGGGGVVVNVSSGAAGRPIEGWSAYCASKAALAMLTRSIHYEYADRGVRAYGFRPGDIDTDMQARIRASGINPESRVPRQDLVKPEIPASAVTWLFRQQPVDLSGQEVDIRDPEFRKRLS